MAAKKRSGQKNIPNAKSNEDSELIQPQSVSLPSISMCASVACVKNESKKILNSYGAIIGEK